MITEDAPTTAPTFADLDLRPELLGALTELGYEEPTPIQRESIPPLLEGRDLLGQAATGTGKTAAFALPILDRLTPGRRDVAPAALVLVPTRELAIQVAEAVSRYGRPLGARVLAIYGGQPIVRQLKALARGVDVVVATPGRALDHVGRSTLRLDALEVVVLDEADEMLDMGFAEDIEALLGAAPASHQTVLFSATMPPRLEGIVGSHLHDPVRIAIEKPRGASEAARVQQRAHMVARAHKPAALVRVLDVETPAAALVFCRTREEVEQVTEALAARGHRAEALHGGMSQEQRDRTMNRLRAGSISLLVATDVAARGLDVDLLTHVVNYDVPAAPEAYVHRIGRVGRAGREGVAVTLVEPREHRMLKSIERVTRTQVPVAPIPSVADLRARRVERTRAELEAVLRADSAPRGDDTLRAAVAALTEEFDPLDLAHAALRLAHEAAGRGAVDEKEIPSVEARPQRGGNGGSARDGGARRPPRANGGGGSREGGASNGGDRSGPGGATTRIYVSLGKRSGIRPQDLVGAITGETSLGGRQIGAIQIAERFSLVEIPLPAADEVIAALRGTRIKGKRSTVRRERFEAEG